MSTLSEALKSAELGIPIVLMEAGTKACKTKNWPQLATTNANQIVTQAGRGAFNYVCVAKAVSGGFLFLDDDGGIRQEYEKVHGPLSPTLKVRSCNGSFHYYFRHSAASLAYQQKIGRAFIAEPKADGKGELWSLRMDDAYVVGPGSTALNKQNVESEWTVVYDTPIIEIPDSLLKFLVDRYEHKKSVEAVESQEIFEGNRNNALASKAGKLRAIGVEGEEIERILLRINEEQCKPPLPETEVMVIAGSVSRYSPNPEVTVLIGGKPAGSNPASTAPVVPAVDVPLTGDEDNEEKIPDFDPSVMNGIYKKIVDLVTAGTTLAPQFAFTVAKTLVGARMAGRVRFENLDVEARYYTPLIGETGSGKGETFRRIMKVFQPEGCINPDSVSQFTCIDSADSGAGLKDAFFDSKFPVVCYVDEVATLGNKSKDTRNPGILDTMGELADRTVISRVLAKRSGGSKTKNDARLSMVMCGQDGSVYTSAFAGRTQIGWWDRLYPEYGVPVEAGKLPPVDAQKAYQLLEELNALNVTQTITMGFLAETYLDEFWDNQPVEVRKKVRWKKHLLLDSFMSAFGRGSEMLEQEDAEIAIKIFLRQLVIRRVCFTTEVPDRVGYYLAQIKRVTSRMKRQLAGGASLEAVSRSRRDFETLTNAFRNNEEHWFTRAWDIHSKVHLQKVPVTRANGQTYERYVPAPDFE